MKPTRRWGWCLGVTVVMLLTLFSGTGAAANTLSPTQPAGTATPVQHFIVMMKDNRSFDNYFGTYPGADGFPPGACAKVKVTSASLVGCIAPHNLDDQPIGTLSTSGAIWASQYDGGKMDGFVSAYLARGLDGTSAMGYYDGTQLPFYWNVADQYVLFDHFFSSATTGSRLNHFYWVTGGPTPGGLERVPAGGYGSIQTIFDRLQAKNISWKFYVEGYNKNVTFRSPGTGTRKVQLSTVPLLNYARFVDSPALASHIVDLGQYAKDLADGTLPAVSYMVTSTDSEAPPGNPAAGQHEVQQLTSALEMSKYWPTSAFLLTYSGWGGMYDNVPPPQVDKYGYGFRVPTLLISPYAHRGEVNHTTLDYTGILKFIEYNWGLKPLATRDAASPGIMSAFDFTAPPRTAQLVGTSRTPPVDLTPHRSLVYIVYGTAVLVGGIMATAAFAIYALRRRRRWRQPALLYPNGG